MGYGYGSGRRSRGRRRARRAAGIIAAVVGVLWFLLGYAAFEQVKFFAKQPLPLQIALFLAIGLALIIGVWLVVRGIGPFFFRRRGIKMTADRKTKPAAKPEPAPEADE